MSPYPPFPRPDEPSFRFQAERLRQLREVCSRTRRIARLVEMGFSEEGRPIFAVELGHGPLRASLVAGSHADEPAGPETLTWLVASAAGETQRFETLLADWTILVVPHVNPDGEERNRGWIERRPDAAAYISESDREPPGRDIEFGYPSMRIENRVVSDYLESWAPLDLHMSLHGMGFGEGALLLIERQWRDRAAGLMEAYTQAVLDAGLPLHDHDRAGEKGFEYMGPGYASTPRGTAMQRYFLDLGDPETAAGFGLSSMELVRSYGGDPLSLVTEIPLYLVTDGPRPSTPGRPARYLDFRERMPLLRRKLEEGESVGEVLGLFGVQAVPLALQMSLQLRAIEVGLETVVLFRPRGDSA